MYLLTYLRVWYPIVNYSATLQWGEGLSACDLLILSVHSVSVLLRAISLFQILFLILKLIYLSSTLLILQVAASRLINCITVVGTWYLESLFLVVVDLYTQNITLGDWLRVISEMFLVCYKLAVFYGKTWQRLTSRPIRVMS